MMVVGLSVFRCTLEIRRAVMAQIEIDSDEIEMLEDILQSYLSDLRMEIADTDLKDFRDNLKHKEDFIKAFLKRMAEQK